MRLTVRRSVLFMPGANARALEKARALAADGLIFDLEDAVAPDKKILARTQVVAAIKQGGYGLREVIVRINALESVWGKEDIRAVADCGADAILLPKVESATQIEQAAEALDQAGCSTDLPIWIMIETPRGVLDIDAIAGSHTRLGVIVMGTSDLAKETRVRHTPDRFGFIAALNLCVLAARAHGLDILDGVYLQLDDEIGYRQVCEQGRDFGFDGKTLIHPGQIAIANTVFGPDQKDIAEAQQIIDAWQQAQRAGKGVVVVAGRLVENLHVEAAKRVIALAQAIKQRSI